MWREPYSPELGCNEKTRSVFELLLPYLVHRCGYCAEQFGSAPDTERRAGDSRFERAAISQLLSFRGRRSEDERVGDHPA